MFHKLLLAIFGSVVALTLLVMGLRGIAGNPTHETLNEPQWRDEGPLELSPDRGRFALLFSYVEDKSVIFTLPVARFATPDLGYKNGNYVSLFAPGLSFLLIPGYLVGKSYGIAQVGSFAVISIFAFFNFLLIRAISIKLGTHSIAATLAGFIFLFATPAFPYAVSLYQHHPSVFLILICLYVLSRWNNFWSLLFVWLACAAAVPLDYPNLFFMFPIGLFAVARFFSISEVKERYLIKIKWPYVFTFLAFIPPLLFFFWFNQASYGNPLQLSGTVASVKVIDAQGLPAAPEGEKEDIAKFFTNPELQEKSALAAFNTRNLLNGLYTHLISPDRGIISFTPIILVSMLGAVVLHKKKPTWAQLLIAIMGTNILLYSMWADPYGGWAFGSRYLIPTYAIASILIGIALTNYKKNILVLVITLLMFVYSTSVNTIGALTSNRNPPKVEVLGLEALSGREEKYTYERNMDILSANRSKSYLYQTYFSRSLTAWQYAQIMIGISVAFFSIATITLFISNDKNSK